MSHERIAGLLDDYLDGALDSDTARAVDAHLAECPACAAEVAALRALADRVTALPRGIDPPRDLWPDIDSRLGRGRLADRSIWSLRYPLAAAAVALIAISSLVTAVLVPRPSAPDTTAAGPAATDAAAMVALRWQAIESEYLRATAELQEALEASKSGLAPETIEMIERDLRIIDGAIQEARAALAADPGSHDLMELLSATYQKKIEVLQQVSRL